MNECSIGITILIQTYKGLATLEAFSCFSFPKQTSIPIWLSMYFFWEIHKAAQTIAAFGFLKEYILSQVC